jgi:hypothetical protein
MKRRPAGSANATNCKMTAQNVEIAEWLSDLYVVAAHHVTN